MEEPMEGNQNVADINIPNYPFVRGYCVICELFVADLVEHQMHRVHMDGTSLMPECYATIPHESTFIMAPRGINLRELAQCVFCKGYVYRRRLFEHRCNIQRIDSPEHVGSGNDLCSMCQTRVRDARDHWRGVHHGNECYEIRSIHEVHTLLPRFTRDEAELGQLSICGFCYCPPFTYLHRIKRTCEICRSFKEGSN